MAPRPILYPLKTSKSVIYPSELRDTSPATTETSQRESGNGPSVPPPRAYTEFLRALSPCYASPEGINASYTRWMRGRALPSPVSLPSTATTVSFPTSNTSKSSPISVSPSPVPAPQSAREPGSVRRLRISPPFVLSPTTAESPRSPFTVRTPYTPADRRSRLSETSDTSNGRTITIQHVVTHTITLKRAPSLDPPPKGKRRRTSESRDQ